MPFFFIPAVYKFLATSAFLISISAGSKEDSARDIYPGTTNKWDSSQWQIPNFLSDPSAVGPRMS